MKRVKASELEEGDVFIYNDSLYELLPPRRIVIRGSILCWIKAKRIVGPTDTRPSALGGRTYLIALSDEVKLVEEE